LEKDRWPRAGGAQLLAMFVTSIAGSSRIAETSMVGSATPLMVLQACIFPGALGLSVGFVVGGRLPGERAFVFTIPFLYCFQIAGKLKHR